MYNLKAELEIFIPLFGAGYLSGFQGKDWQKVPA